jgi:hypothetical protein
VPLQQSYPPESVLPAGIFIVSRVGETTTLPLPPLRTALRSRRGDRHVWTGPSRSPAVVTALSVSGHCGRGIGQQRAHMPGRTRSVNYRPVTTPEIDYRPSQLSVSPRRGDIQREARC